MSGVKMSAAAERLLKRLKDDCVHYDRRPSKKVVEAIEELNSAGFFVQTENPIHEGWWVTYYPGKRNATR